MAPRPCTWFQTNSCKKGVNCIYPHVIDPSFKRKACMHFAQGKCRKANDCTYSHAPDDIAFLRSTSGGGETDGRGSANTEAHFRQWRYFFPPPDQMAPVRPLGPARTKFCQEALELVDGEAGVMQEVITLLASEAGCVRVKEIVEQQLSQCNTAQHTRIFDAQILPFFKTITHKNVTSSLILAPRLMTVYNIIYGEDGQRAVMLFTAVTKHLQTLRLIQPGELGAADNVSADIIETTLTAFDKLVEVNTESQVHGGLRFVVETLRQLFENPLPAAAAFAYRPALKYLRRIEQRFGLGQALPDSKDQSHNASRHAVFDLARERPGGLSEDGPRHDNDHVDIRQISILPTLQEIQSPRNEYLPLADPREWHIGGLKGLLDRHFRLLREDTIGQLRDSAKFELERLHDPHVQDRKRPGARTFVYRNVAVSDLAFDSFRGMEFALSFDQPAELQTKSENQRRDWWEGSRRLGHEALVCLLRSEGSATFFIVSPAPGMPKKDLQTGKTIQPLHKSYNLWSEVERAHVVAKPVDQSDVYVLLDQLTTGPAEQLSLVESPGVLLPTFMPTLQAMQTMSETLDMPFAEVLAPVSTAANIDDEVDVGTPNYTTKPGFRYDLSAVTKAGRQLFMTSARNIEETTLELTTHSSLDFGQAQSVVSSLPRSLALIQGPPGTGKSYTGVQLIKILLHNKKAGDLGPIICVCYTNHALDQGLERLVDEGVKNVVRIGGNSKSERLAEVNLRAVVQRLDLTKTEKNDRYKLMKKLDVELKEITDILAQMGKLGTEASLGAYLQAYYPEVHAQLFSGVDDDGWERVDSHRNGFVETWLRGAPWGYRRPRTVDNLRDVNITHMTGQERRLIRDAWIKDMHTELQNKLHTAMAAYDMLKKQLDAIRTELDLRVLRQANIIGVTTSGLARNLDLIRRTGAKVLVCEEAGEVLECHLLTALLPSVEHAILIGDHQQLRPHISNYSLSCESKNGSQYALDVSLFERLVKPQDLLAQALPFCTLSVQRRMHPQISQLVRRTLYPLLQDAPSLDRPPVVGMRHRLFWMDHEHKENEGGDASATESRTNDYEVDMVAALVKHLVHQGVYNAEDVAVITPYLGQLRKIRKKLGSTFNTVLNDRDIDELKKDGVHDLDEETASADPSRAATVARGNLLQAIRVATVDNFQEEEAKVVVVSLVRCNSKNNAGFLKTSNRINVLLSRAKNGMYILGNGETMAQVDMWAEVMEIFKQDGCFGPKLELCCPRHEDTPLQVTTPDDFLRISPEAGCDLACEKQLPCGHACVSKCHADLLHNAVHCLKPCTRPKDGCSHNCPKSCGDKCDTVCLETVDVDVELACGHHKTSLPCYQYQDQSKVLCGAEVDKTVPGCGHHVKEPCHVDTESGFYHCLATCGAPLPCGHTCLKPCFKCRLQEDDDVRVEHGACRQTCDRPYTTCSHRDTSICHGANPCRLCPAKCEVRCSHVVCGKKCYESCSPCLEPECSSRCPHSTCTNPCAAPCNWMPCNLRCDKVLSCGCQCPSVCGEACPPAEMCQNCGSEEVKAIQADLIMFEPYGDIDLDTDPCIFTACRHIFTLSTLDGIMSMADHYKIDDGSGTVVGLKTSSEPFSSHELKACPVCRGSLRNIARYGRIVRRALPDESAKKLVVWANKTYTDLAENLATNEEQLLASIDTVLKPSQETMLLGSPLDQCRAVRTSKTGQRYRKVFTTRRYVEEFVKRLRKEEQPYQRVRDLVETARRKNAEAGIAEFDFASSELQFRERLQAVSLLIRCDVVIFSDVINMHDMTAAGRTKGVLELEFTANRAACDDLVKEARETHSVREDVEGQLLWARFAAMECGAFDVAREDVRQEAIAHNDALNAEALDRLTLAEDVCDQFAGKKVSPTQGLADQISDVRRMLNAGVSTSEMTMVVAAMAREFLGTGHWYRCANGHPFTIGECGMPMELARCPACGSSIGGQNHQATEGVEHARDIETQFGGLRL